MKKKITDFKLQIAENEIDNIVAENCGLKCQILGKHHKIELLIPPNCEYPRINPITPRTRKGININPSNLDTVKRKTKTVENNFFNKIKVLKNIEIDEQLKISGPPEFINIHHLREKTHTKNIFRKICIVSQVVTH